MSAPQTWIREKALTAINPQQVSRTLARIAETWPAHAMPLPALLEVFPLGEEALYHLFSVSSICATRIINDPEILLWLSSPAICKEASGYGRMFEDLRTLTGDSAVAEANFRALRIWKGREMTRLALREVANVAPLESITAELSRLADICLSQVFQHWDTELRKRLGSPDADFTILGLGKLGGRELNHSSDVDLIFLYSEEGQLTANLSYHEFFNRLSAKIVETFSATSADGSLFRIDLRLRPEGSAGPLARSLESMENYYAGFGEAWEQLALVRARRVCGSEELAYEFLRQHQPFIYPKSPTPDLLEEVARVKQRIERDVVGHENLERNVKLGAGGIREIEFIVQALQLIHGARHTFLQETSTLKTLRALGELELLAHHDVFVLDDAYRFLRTVEHRLQIEAEQQTHTIPESRDAQWRLALSLGFANADEMSAALHEHMSNVRKIFARQMSETTANLPAEPDLSCFRDQTRAEKALAELSQGRPGFHVAPRTRQVFRKLRPLLLRQLATAGDPDVSLNQFVRFVEVYGLRSLLFELLVVNPRLLELLIKTFDASVYAGEMLVRHPQLLEEVTRSGMLDRSLTVTDHLARLAETGATAEKLDPMRTYRQTRTLRILLRDILHIAPPEKVFAEHSVLAEACLVFMDRLLGDADALTIIALGKFGGGEITYGADLDVLFVGENVRAAQSLIVQMAQRSSEGNIATLDARLRPDGEKGSLVCSLTTYESYYTNRAQLWEIQALTRARPICGPEQQPFLEMAQRVWRAAGQRGDLIAQIRDMAERVRRERSSGADLLDFKTGTGGMVEAEFLVQALQMRAGIWEANWGRALQQLVAANLIAEDEGKALHEGYALLRNCETCLRRWENKSVSALPNDDFALRRLAVWAGYPEMERFSQDYLRARENVHTVYERRMR